MGKLFSTTELARMWNVSESTIKRWCDAGDLKCVKTPGGHRRFNLEAISRFRSMALRAFGSSLNRRERVLYPWAVTSIV